MTVKVTENNVSDTDNNVEEDPDYKELSSDETPNVVSEPPADTFPAKNEKLLWSRSPLNQQSRLKAILQSILYMYLRVPVQ